MWPKTLVARPGDIWLLALLLWCFPLLGISLGILFPLHETSSPKYSTPSTAVPVYRQDWTPSNEPKPITKTGFGH